MVIGQKIEIDGKPFEIAGVAPPEFLSESVGESADVWTTMALMPAEMRTAPGYAWLNIMGRLRPSVPATQAAAGLKPNVSRMLNRFIFIERVEIEPGRFGGAGLRNFLGTPLMMMAFVSMALLTACTNLAADVLASQIIEMSDNGPPTISRPRMARSLITSISSCRA